MPGSNKKKPRDAQWEEAGRRYGLSHRHLAMAKKLGMNPKKLGGLANHRQEPWKLPLPQFIEALHEKRFGSFEKGPAASQSVAPRAPRAHRFFAQGTVEPHVPFIVDEFGYDPILAAEDVHSSVRSIHAAVRTDGTLLLVGDTRDEQAHWRDCELALLAEHRLGDVADPTALDEARRAHWLAKACDGPLAVPARRSSERCYWIVDRRTRVGIVAVDARATGEVLFRVNSLYVLPSQRGRGVATRVLDELRAASEGTDLSMRLETSWSWQRAVRWYLQRGMWVHMWKHGLVFRDPGVGGAVPHLEIGEREATLAIDVNARAVVLVRASRDGSTLRFEETEDARALRETRRWEVPGYHAASTLAVAIAAAGWPLVRSEREWEENREAPGHAPEGLAQRIATWERTNAQRGWRSDAPTIPGFTP